jgi:hypothetical protein
MPSSVCLYRVVLPGSFTSTRAGNPSVDGSSGHGSRPRGGLDILRVTGKPVSTGCDGFDNVLTTKPASE